MPTPHQELPFLRRFRVQWSPRALLAIALPAFVTMLGCGGEDQIRTYVVPEPPEFAGDAAEAGDASPKSPEGPPTHRMLAAIIPGDSQAWYLKATVDASVADAVAPAINAYFDTVRLDDDGKPVGDAPEGWTDRGPSGMRLTTLKIPTDKDPVELTVTGLSTSPDWQGLLLGNVNRWRGQLSLPPTTAAELTKSARKLASAPEGSIAVDLNGWMSGDGMSMRMPGMPMAGGAAAPPPRPPRRVPPARQPRLTYDTPDGWEESAGSSMRLASLKAGDGADISVFAFPAAGAMGDPVENVNRWRGQVGLPPTTADELAKESESVTLDDVEGQFIVMQGKEQSILAAMATRDSDVWFFKLIGPVETVTAEQDAFKAWIKSVRFAGNDSPEEGEDGSR